MGEYIEREAAIAALIEFRGDQTVSKYATVMQYKAARDAISRATKVLESLPAADVEPVKGEMIMDEVKNYPPYLDYPKPYKPQTNADKIRAMNDDELADLINREIGYCAPTGDCEKTSNDCKACWLDWLQQPSEVEE